MGKRSGVIQVLVACGCVLLGVAIAVVGGLTWFFFFRKAAPTGPPAMTDSGQVKALAEQILPGAEPPPGHVGFLGQSSGNYLLAFQGPAGLPKDGTLQPGQLMISMISFPAGQATRDQAEKQLRDVLVGQGYKLGVAGKTLEQQEGALTPLMGELHFVRRTFDGSPRLLEYSMLLENSAGRTVVLQVEGPLDAFNMPALEAYLNKLQAHPLGSPSRAPVATPPTAEPTPHEAPTLEDTPTPEDTPTVVETPAQEETPTPAPRAKETPRKKPHR